MWWSSSWIGSDPATTGVAQEIIRVCDRTLVMFHGSVQGELVGDEMNEQAIMRLATGGQV